VRKRRTHHLLTCPLAVTHLVCLVDVNAALPLLGPQDLLVAADVEVLLPLQVDPAAREEGLQTYQN